MFPKKGKLKETLTYIRVPCCIDGARRTNNK